MCAPPLRTVMVLCGGSQCVDLDIILYGGYSSLASLAAASSYVKECVALCNFSATDFLKTCVFAYPMCSSPSTTASVARWLQACGKDAGSLFAPWMELQITIRRYTASHADRWDHWFSSIGEVLQMLQQNVKGFPAIRTSPRLQSAIVAEMSSPRTRDYMAARDCQPEHFTDIMLPRKWLSTYKSDSFIQHVRDSCYEYEFFLPECSALSIVLELVAYSLNAPGPWDRGRILSAARCR